MRGGGVAVVDPTKLEERLGLGCTLMYVSMEGVPVGGLCPHGTQDTPAYTSPLTI